MAALLTTKLDPSVMAVVCQHFAETGKMYEYPCYQGFMIYFLSKFDQVMLFGTPWRVGTVIVNLAGITHCCLCINLCTEGYQQVYQLAVASLRGNI